MNSSNERINYLLRVWTSGKGTPTEEAELFEYVRLAVHEKDIENHIQSLIAGYTGEEVLPAVDWERLYANILANRKGTRVVRFRERFARAISVAAILILIAAGGWWYMAYRASKDKEQEMAQRNAPHKMEIPAPISNRATIQLADGRIVHLDSAANGQLARIDGVELLKMKDGQIVYSGHAKETSYNTLTNPKNSQPIDIALSDGSRVWLNAGSSITYPVAFLPGKERVVTMAGEAYFEIKHNAQAPFKVKVGNEVIEDIGTSFNVNAYPDEPGIKTTLVEGVVKINKAVLQPGEQYLNGNVSAGNIEQALAWKQGFFGFDHADIRSVMREIGRWYDVEVVFENVSSQAPFQGKIARGMPLEQLLKHLENYAVRFRIEENKRVVVSTPKP